MTNRVLAGTIGLAALVVVTIGIVATNKENTPRESAEEAPKNANDAPMPEMIDARGYTAQADTPTLVFSEYDQPLSEESDTWLHTYVIDNPRGVEYDRHRLVSVDLQSLLISIKSSPQALSAQVGEVYSGTHYPDFLFRPFDDRTYRLEIRRAHVDTSNAQHVTAVSGISHDMDDRAGDWMMVINEDSGEMLGEINSPNEWINFWPSPNQQFHVIAEQSQENRLKQMQQKSEW